MKNYPPPRLIIQSTLFSSEELAVISKIPLKNYPSLLSHKNNRLEERPTRQRSRFFHTYVAYIKVSQWVVICCWRLRKLDLHGLSNPSDTSMGSISEKLIYDHIIFLMHLPHTFITCPLEALSQFYRAHIIATYTLTA